MLLEVGGQCLISTPAPSVLSLVVVLLDIVIIVANQPPQTVVQVGWVLVRNLNAGNAAG